jgi:hypothetical protein
MDVVALINTYGPGFVLVVLVLSNLSKIGAALERVAGLLLPSWAEERKLKLEVERDAIRHSRESKERERLDTIAALTEMLIAYKASLSDSAIERQRCQAELVKVVGQYEKHGVASVEVLRDVSAVLQEQSRVLNRIAVAVGVYNDGKK